MTRWIAKALFIISLAVGMVPDTLNAYDVETHLRISEAAVGVSQLAGVLGSLYLTADSKFASSDIGRPQVNTGTAIGWIREGSIREDGDSNCSTRVRNHFYNPINNAGYFRGVYQGAPSADWGLEDFGGYSEQEFSYADARAYFW